MKLKLSASALLLTVMLPFAAHADVPGHHPGYLHALTDLRDARWNLEHRPGDPAVSAQEDVAITEIDQAIDAVKRAAIADGKDLYNRPKEDARIDHSGRLHQALDLLRQAHNDLAQEEDNPSVRELQHHAFEHLDNAIHATEHAVRDVEHYR
jgi:hypothetical protein